MTAIGGSLQEATFNGRVFPVAADAEVQRKIGGFENEVQSNGDGSARLIKTRTPWSWDGLVVEIDDSRGDQEFLQELADRNDYFPVSLTYASGDTWQATGQFVSDLQMSSQNATGTVSMMGPGQATKQ